MTPLPPVPVYPYTVQFLGPPLLDARVLFAASDIGACQQLNAKLRASPDGTTASIGLRDGSIYTCTIKDGILTATWWDGLGPKGKAL